MTDDLPPRRSLPAELQNGSTPIGRSTGLQSRAPTPDHGELIVAAEQMRLSELDFTDLYLSEMGRALIRGVAESEGPLVPVPEIFSDDVNRLHGMVCDKGDHEREFMTDYDGVRYRCSKIETVKEVWYALRRAKTPIPRLGVLRLMPRALQHLAWLGKQSGLIVVAGATGQGKTTTASMLLREYLLNYGEVAVTVEDPPELPLEGEYPFGQCFQLKVQNGDFGAQLRATMRYMPKYILIGEIRAAAEASQALTAAINGHLVITTIHAGSITEALQRLLKIAAAEDDLELASGILADGLAAVIHQRMLKVKDPQTGLTRVSIVPQFLFTGKEHKVRTKIRERKFETLKDDIEQQRIRMASNRPPVEVSERQPGSAGGRRG